MSTLRVDHVIYAVRDLDAAAARLLADHGLASLEGGRHPGWGTENRIVPLGSSYLELVGVVDSGEAAASAFGDAVLRAVGERDQLVGWVAATDDLDGVASRLGLEVAAGSRIRPDGTTLAWRLAGVAEALATGALPFFIQWDGAPELHPGRSPAGHTVNPRGIDWLEVSTDAASIGPWLGEHELPLRVVHGPPGLTAVGIDAGASEIVLR